MGLRACIVVCATSFLLGVLFTHWIADSLTLWKAPITDDNLWTAASYYSLFARNPSALGYVLSAVIALGASTILWSLRDGAAGNLMFDSASILLYGVAVAVYANKVLPDFTASFSNIPPVSSRGAVPGALKAQVLNLASANLVCSVALTGVLALQAGRWWAERADPEEEAEALQTEDARLRRQSATTQKSVDRGSLDETSSGGDARRRETQGAA